MYCNGRSVVVRDLAVSPLTVLSMEPNGALTLPCGFCEQDPSKSWRFTGHSQAATAARFAPTGAYVASGGQHFRLTSPRNMALTCPLFVEQTLPVTLKSGTLWGPIMLSSLISVC